MDELLAAIIESDDLVDVRRRDVAIDAVRFDGVEVLADTDGGADIAGVRSTLRFEINDWPLAVSHSLLAMLFRSKLRPGFDADVAHSHR